MDVFHLDQFFKGLTVISSETLVWGTKILKTKISMTDLAQTTDIVNL